ncbi:type II toxin-antitoxin system VapC family toxin [Candidatus Neomicrothrix sp.]|jgi:predicted nucleic acid-binding protein|uniref:type II toxin-antitoxin system VapC family toxin n=1 Tax=Candidatus Neomicrothrix sp. TaxID=2719034 RepID=UPI001697EF64|nr:type II toxin-antitoxin system VapC family toxin [Candidatus Microthrix sp.]NLH67341.1 type II toxin-antitoxin system VapC family toxin [Candidatus Microthrix parvicella]MBK7021170.1 type II toxin-antitoxin system VapC family toxin [Candidatus Microthrix sp.]MBP6149291.1 type II toxin-antitoxin system VapC family toxin [Candidatus Microthrix sp.]MBP7404623.1 type II toxin-antitoxin system VapC family toxin [Candidatus Microthrix sp.]MBP7853776.1 type II toxin-antitoxin system VapC family to
MFVLDTNVVSELRKAASGRANKGVTDWAKSVPATLMFLSVISLHELEHGILLAERSDPPKGAILRTWLDSSVMPAFEDRLLPVNAEIARQAAAMHVPNPAPFRDALIAATALHHDMTVITRNTSDFDRFDKLTVTNPWT